MLKIVDVSPYTPLAKGFGGIARSTGAYLQALRSISPDVHLISTTSSIDGHVSVEDLETALPGIHAHLYDASVSKKWGIGLGLLSKLPVLAGADAVIIHGTRNWPSLVASAVCRLLGKRYFTVAHATLDTSRMKRTREKHPMLYALAAALVSWTVRGSEAIIVSGALEARALPENLKDMQTIEIENFFAFDLNNVKPGSYEADKTYLFVGRIESDKGILKFIQIWKLAASAGSRLTVVGSGAGEYFDQVMAALKNDPRITYRGELNRKDTLKLIRESSVTVLPTGLDARVTENFGNTVAEALIEGRPAMVTRGLHWDAYDGSPALMIFGTGDDDIRRAIVEFDAAGRDEYAGMTAAAVELSSRFHLEKATGSLRKVLEGGSGSRRA